MGETFAETGGPETGSCAVKISVLKKRADFLRVAAGRQKWVSNSMILQLAKSPDLDDLTNQKNQIRVGYTASKKVGNAVKRVRAKRRLREVVRACLADGGQAGHDYVLIARTATPDLPYDQLIRDFKWCLKRLNQPAEGKSETKKPKKGKGIPVLGRLKEGE